ncbi:hypothetical protein HI031_07670 [Staphylococcus haemolyticus]|nr:hypothetical protein HI031_07670 [Staphylococcus haemolyticus]
MSKEQILNFLGLAMRARKVKSGESVLLTEIKKNNIKLVIMASDASENTVKNIKNKCESYHVPFRIFSTRAELGQSLGKSEPTKLTSMIDEYCKE